MMTRAEIEAMELPEEYDVDALERLVEYAPEIKETALAAMDERDKAVEKLEGVTGHLMSLLSAGMCDKHRAEIKTESFVTFMQREKDLGCTRCLSDERDRLTELVRELAEVMRRLRRDHHECEDSYYSCPKGPEGYPDEIRGYKCNCGADEDNETIGAAIAKAEEALDE